MTNFETLIKSYLTRGTSERQTQKIEAMLDVIKEREIAWISDETLELLSNKLNNDKITDDEVQNSIKSLYRLKVSDVEWMKFKGDGCFLFPKKSIECHSLNH